jgi:hypothetical protein
VTATSPSYCDPTCATGCPKGHLAWFILDVVDQLDLQSFYRQHRDDGHGHPAYDPKTLLGVLLYAYATGVRSSRQIPLELRHRWTMVEEEHDADPVVGSTSPGRWPRCPRVSAPQDRLREQPLAHLARRDGPGSRAGRACRGVGAVPA